MLDRQGAAPLYLQIANVLRAQIADGDFLPGERLPSESKLAEEFAVSIVTLRQALDQLKADDLIERRQGAGTFVSARALERAVISVPLQTISMRLSEFDVELLSSGAVPTPADIAPLLGVASGEPCWRVRRVRRGAPGPVSYSSGYYSVEIGAVLARTDLSVPSLTVILETAGFRFTSATQTIEASLASIETARILQVPVGSPILLSRRAYRMSGDDAGYAIVTRHPSPTVRFEAQLGRGSHGSWILAGNNDVD